MEATLDKTTIDLIDKIKSLVSSKGIVKEEVVSLLKELRPHFIDQKEPLITRVVRLTAEYVNEHGTFNLNLLAEEDEDGNKPTDINLESPDSFNEIKENFIYLMDLCANPDNDYNKQELTRIKFIYLDRGMF